MERRFFWSILLAGGALIAFRPGPLLLVGADSACYARVARELAERPAADFTRLTLGGAEFFEHPPLGFWLESLAFRALGATAGVAVWLTRAYAWLTLLWVGLAGRRWAGASPVAPWVGTWCMVGLLALPGFLHESQVPMLEMPLALTTAVGVFALGGLALGAAGSMALFIGAVVAGFWIKGPPILVLLGLAAAMTALRRLPARVALTAAAASLAALCLSVAGFDLLRAGLGQEPFFARYLQRQVLVSLVQGRHNPNRNLLYFAGPLVSWYLPALGAAALTAAAVWRRSRGDAWAALFPDRVAQVGWVLWGGVVGGFTLATQKADWYIHFGAVGAALGVGAALSLLPRRAVPGVMILGGLVTLAWPLLTLRPAPLTDNQARLYAVQRLQFPAAAQAPRVVADCSGQEGWVTEHLMEFAWRAHRVDCDQPAGFRFDGAQLVPIPLLR